MVAQMVEDLETNPCLKTSEFVLRGIRSRG